MLITKDKIMKQLFEELMALQDTQNKFKFFYKDFVTQLGTKCRVFSYHYASYTDWLLPSALESRGIMFELDDENQPIRIMARPMEKFFNLNETPFTMDLDLNDLEYAMAKEDGSLISTYADQGILFTKSKTSITSTQAIESKQLLLDGDYKDLHDRVLELTLDGFTCNFEYVSPNNRIVLAYDKKNLVLLNVRENDTGAYVPIGELKADPVLRKYLVENHVTESEGEPEDMIAKIRGMVGIEGFVFQHGSGIKFKLKTEWYSNLHRMKDTLNNNEALFMTVVAGGSDDIKSLYTDDWSKTKIETFEIIFLDWLKLNSAYVFDLYKSLLGSDRKTFAISAQTKLKADGKLELFGVLMEMYKGVDETTTMNNLNMIFMKNYEKYVPEQYKVLTEKDI